MVSKYPRGSNFGVGAKIFNPPADKSSKYEIYSWIANWERKHSKMLVEIDKALVETIWHDNKFWPF